MNTKRPQGYYRHYITFFRYYDNDSVLRFRIDSEPPQDTEQYLDAETHVVVTPLAADDFFNPVLFRNVHAVVRFIKQVGNAA